jgi:peptide/nickel transport system permease protein
MIGFFAARILQAILVVLAMTMIVFIGVHVIGDPVAILVSPETDAATRAQIVAALHLDQPLWKQYLIFLQGILHGDLGNSFVFNQAAFGLILERMPATLELAVSALLLSLAIGLPLGIYCGLCPNTFLARSIMAISVIGFSLPAFWLGLMLIMIFAVNLGWLPSNGRGATAPLFGIQWSFLTWDGLRHVLLPALTLSLFKLAMVLRLVRAGVQEILPQEFVRYARAKGLKRSRIIGVHVLKNLMIPVVTVVGMEFGTTIAFSVVTETVFGWPGMGKLIIDSINSLDRPVIVSYLIVIVIVFSTINVVVDLLYFVLDPRIRVAPQ